MAAAAGNVVSPELVLVDPHLAPAARRRLADGDDTLARLSRALGTARRDSQPKQPALTTFDDGAWAALQRITEGLTDAELEPARRRSRRTWLLLAISLIGLAAGGTAVLADRDGSIGDVRSAELVAQATPGHPRGSGAREPTALAGSGEGTVARPAEARPGTEAAIAAPDVRPASAHAGTSDDVPTVSVSTPTATFAIPAGPPRPAHPAREFRWTPVPNATAYRVELRRGKERIFVTDTKQSRVVIPSSWDLGGVRLRLQPEDQLYVWPVISGKQALVAAIDGAQVIDLP